MTEAQVPPALLAGDPSPMRHLAPGAKASPRGVIPPRPGSFDSSPRVHATAKQDERRERRAPPPRRARARPVGTLAAATSDQGDGDVSAHSGVLPQPPSRCHVGEAIGWLAATALVCSEPKRQRRARGWSGDKPEASRVGAGRLEMRSALTSDQAAVIASGGAAISSTKRGAWGREARCAVTAGSSSLNCAASIEARNAGASSAARCPTR